MGSAASVTCQLLAAFRAVGLNAQYDIGPTGQPLHFQLVLPPYSDRSGMKTVLVARVVKAPNKHGYAIWLAASVGPGRLFRAHDYDAERKASSRGIKLTVQSALDILQRDLGPTGFFLYLASQAA